MKIIVILLWLFIHAVCYAEIQTQAPSKAALGETIRLTLSIVNGHDNQVPDLTPLQQDFDILGTERSASYSLVNGQGTSTHQWVILIVARHKGQLTIPALQFGQEQSLPSQIEIVDQAPSATQEKLETEDYKEVFLTTELDNKKIYVNQQVIYKVKLYHLGQLLSVDYQPPQIDNALVVPFTTTRRYQQQIKQQSYVVEELSYAIFPGQRGEVVIKPPAVSALMYDYVPRRLQARGEEQRLMVNAPLSSRPSQQSWLPAKRIHLSESYEPIKNQLMQGDTVVRHVHVQAVGVANELLPTLTFASKLAISAYPEKPRLNYHIDNENVVSDMDYKITYLLHKSGTRTIPALALSWFNTTTGKIEVAGLPAHSFEIAAKKTKVKTISLPAKAIKPILIHGWYYGVVGVLLITAWGFYQSFRKRKPKRKKSLSALQFKKNPQQACEALITWAKKRWPAERINHLHDVARQLDQEALKIEITKLSQALFKKTDEKAWDGKNLWRLLKAYRRRVKKPKSKKKRKGLPTL